MRVKGLGCKIAISHYVKLRGLGFRVLGLGRKIANLASYQIGKIDYYKRGRTLKPERQMPLATPHLRIPWPIAPLPCSCLVHSPRLTWVSRPCPPSWGVLSWRASLDSLPPRLISPRLSSSLRYLWLPLQWESGSASQHLPGAVTFRRFAHFSCSRQSVPRIFRQRAEGQKPFSST